jgi:murein DD-endopeptidase MepM/ murein hydrolase activator NlpD
VLAALVAAGQVSAQGLPPSVEFRVPKPPTVAVGDSGAFLAYELHVTNLTPNPLVLRRVEVRAVNDTGRVLFALADSALARVLTRPGQTIMASERPSIAGGARANVFLWVPVTTGSAPSAVTHRLTFARDTITHVITGAVTPVSARAVSVGAPLRGEWLAANGPNNFSGHRRGQLGLMGTVTISQRFGIDFLQVDEQGRTFTGTDSTNNKSYYAYGENIHAVGDGRVVFTKDSIPENAPRSPVARAVPIDLVTVAGNNIVVDMGGGAFAFYAHIQSGTLRVKLGDRVKRGDVLGLVGNSGNSTEPHLHFHIVDGVAWGTSTLGAEGVPYAIESFELIGRCQFGAGGIQCPRIGPIPVRGGIPLQNQLVRFR